MDGMSIQINPVLGNNTCRSFLFDIFLGSSYNQSPPSVKYMTVRLHSSLGLTSQYKMKI